MAAPRLFAPAMAEPVSCRVERPRIATVPQPGAVAAARSWRITDRGIALVLATGLAIAAAAIVVVGLTAFRVTGEGYQPVGRAMTQLP